ncbi:MAG: hypothetical protein HS104_36330 [Polyangiaceae bacterium]|nr:hypothetical protein [Polyangiaceae bacterium]MCL4750279.1 hypothetical protein [Myxococcales bacterium]
MLARDIRLEGFTTDDWVRLAEVFRSARPSAELDDPAERGEEPSGSAEAAAARASAGGRRRGGVIAVSAGGKLKKLVGTELGRLDLAAEPWPEPLDALAERYGCRWAAQIERGALDDLMERFAGRLRRDHDALGQMLLFVNVLRELETEGRLAVWPWKINAWPMPHEGVLLRAFDALCPDGKSMMLGVFRQGELYTCLVARRKGAGFDLILGPDRLRSEMGLVAGDFRRDYRHLSRAAEQAAGPIALGCFGELDTLRALVDKPVPGAWAAAVAARDVILAPAVPAVALPLGIDVGRAAIVAVRGFAERMGAGAWLSADGPLGPTLSRVREMAHTPKDVRQLLGFDPIELLRRLFSRGGAE